MFITRWFSHSEEVSNPHMGLPWPRYNVLGIWSWLWTIEAALAPFLSLLSKSGVLALQEGLKVNDNSKTERENQHSQHAPTVDVTLHSLGKLGRREEVRVASGKGRAVGETKRREQREKKTGEHDKD